MAKARLGHQMTCDRTGHRSVQEVKHTLSLRLSPKTRRVLKLELLLARFWKPLCSRTGEPVTSVPSARKEGKKAGFILRKARREVDV